MTAAKTIQWNELSELEQNAVVDIAFKGYDPRTDQRRPIPAYLTEPNAFWPLVEEMKAHIGWSRQGWYCEPFRETGNPSYAATPGEAACIAHLRFKGRTVVV